MAKAMLFGVLVFFGVLVVLTMIETVLGINTNTSNGNTPATCFNGLIGLGVAAFVVKRQLAGVRKGEG